MILDKFSETNEIAYELERGEDGGGSHCHVSSSCDLDWFARMLVPLCARRMAKSNDSPSYMDRSRNGQSFSHCEF